MKLCILHSGELHPELQNPSNIDECPFCMNGRQLRGAHNRANRAEEALREAVKLLQICETVAYEKLTYEGCCRLKEFLSRYEPDRCR